MAKYVRALLMAGVYALALGALYGLLALFFGGCSSSGTSNSDAPAVMAAPSYLEGTWLCTEPEGYGWATVTPAPRRFTYDGFSGPEPRRWCRKLGELAILQEQGARVLARLHHLAPAAEVDFMIDVDGATWTFTNDAGDELFVDQCTRCPAAACDAHAASPWPLELGVGGDVTTVCDPRDTSTPDGFTRADLVGIPPSGDAWERPLDGTPPDGQESD